MKTRIVFFAVLLFICIPAINALAQEVKYIGFEPGDGKVFIYYEMLSCDEGTEYNVSVKLKRKNIPTFELIPSTASGDIGTVKCTPGTKTIVWLTTPSEEASLDGDDFYFEPNIKEIPRGGIAWYYYVAAAIVGGGAYFLLANGGDDGGTPAATPFPAPPGRP
ncbi:MAG: hypothetical protein HUU54_10490 [Ignavibacteriaceae bacterium]|nr:hypothetical protein [Ignavibacteriaceae bacterium]